MTWKNLQTASGPATRVPRQVEDVITGDARKRAQGVHALLTTLVEPGRWFSASAPTADLILRSVADAPQDAPGAGRALWIALDIITALNEDFLRGVHSWGSTSEAEACREVVEGAQPALLRLLSHQDPSVRAPAAALLALGQGDRQAATAALAERWDGEADPFALAHLLLASGLLELFAGKRAPELAERLEPFSSEDRPDVVRTAAALAHLASAHDLPPSVAKSLPAAMHRNLTPDSVGWCDGRWPHLVAAVSRRVGAHVVPLVTHALHDDLRASSRYSTNQKTYWARVALDAAELDVDYDPWAKTPVRDLEDFTPLQREVISELAPFFIAFTGTGVPQGVRARLRWLGQAPPGLLEQVRDWALGDETVRWPLWKIWQYERERLLTSPPGGFEGCLPPTIAAALTESERVEALIETYDFSYGLNRRWSPDEDELVSTRIRGAADDDPLVRLVCDILANHANEPSEEPSISDHPIDLLVARGLEFPPEWDWYVRWQNRDHFEALPTPERREARLLATLPAPDSPDAEFELPDVVDLLPLVPTRDATLWVLQALQHLRRASDDGPPAEVTESFDQVVDLAETEPDVKAALDDARRGDWLPLDSA